MKYTTHRVPAKRSFIHGLFFDRYIPLNFDTILSKSTNSIVILHFIVLVAFIGVIILHRPLAVLDKMIYIVLRDIFSLGNKAFDTLRDLIPFHKNLTIWVPDSLAAHICDTLRVVPLIAAALCTAARSIFRFKELYLFGQAVIILEIHFNFELTIRIAAAKPKQSIFVAFGNEVMSLENKIGFGDKLPALYLQVFQTIQQHTCCP